MTREEEINNEATNYGYFVAGGCPERVYASRGFQNGAKWADKNQPSPWISVKDDLPCNYEELILYDVYTKQVMVAYHEGCIGIQRMKKSCNGIIGVEPWWQWEIPSVVYYWMPIPELPKE